jgi:hypothetical protein
MDIESFRFVWSCAHAPFEQQLIGSFFGHQPEELRRGTCQHFFVY